MLTTSAKGRIRDRKRLGLARTIRRAMGLADSFAHHRILRPRIALALCQERRVRPSQAYPLTRGSRGLL
jgi:hypothetical protein